MSAANYTAHSRPIDNYIYLYHTDDLIIVPEFADSITDTLQVNFSQTNVLSRTAPIFSYSNSGPRTIQFTFNLHRDMMDDINSSNNHIRTLEGEDPVDTLVREIHAAALPSYETASKMVNPPLVAVRLGTDVFIKGIVQGSIGITYKYPVIPGRKSDGSPDYTKNRYSSIDIAFNVAEIDPYDADMVKQMGSFRGLSTTLERKVLSANLIGNAATTSKNMLSTVV